MRAVMDSRRIYYALSALFVALLLAGDFLRHTLSALLTSLVLAYLVNPLLKYLEKRGLSRFLSITLLYAILALAGFLASFILLPYLGHQVDSLINALPRYVQSLKVSMNRWQQELAVYYTHEDLGWLLSQSDELMSRLAEELSGRGYERMKGLFFALFNLLLAPILVFFMLLYKEAFRGFLLGFFPEPARSELKVLGRRINRTLERFILAMLFDCFLVGILCSAALYALDIEFPILNGMFAGFATVVPFVGAAVAVIPPALIGYAKGGDLWIIPKVCALYFLINVVIEGNLIKPLVMRGSLKVNPLAVIFAVMAMGELMGFWGVILAIPLAAVAKICLEEVKSLMRQNIDNGRL